jgi:membrane protease YdiL (CAAX protease family)
MWIRVGLVALLVLREWDAGPVGFWPRAQEWRIGILWFTLGVLPLIGVALLVKDMRVIVPAWSWQLAATALGTFFAGLWVIGLSEELFFRGFVERALLNAGRWNQPALAVAVSALLFGAVHLWFRPFPDYRRFVTVVILGIFCGLAYWQSRSIRASMVTHACAIVTMRLFFRG